MMVTWEIPGKLEARPGECEICGVEKLSVDVIQ